MAVWNWIVTNWATIVSIVMAAHALALLIVNATPTPKDNEIYGKIYKWIEKIAGIMSGKAKE